MKTTGLTALALFLSMARSAHAEGAPATSPGAAAPSNAGASAGATFSTSSSDEASDDAVWAARDKGLEEEATLTGGVGLLHMQHAQGGAPGQFRLGFTGSYATGEFLCTSDHPCTDPTDATRTIDSDSNTRTAGHLTLSVQVLRWLEGYLATSASSNSNRANRPSLLQVIGDTNLGAKVHGKLGRVLHLGGAAELWLMSGATSVGFDGASTSAKFRGLATVDLRDLPKSVPLRISANVGYVLDNSAAAIEDTEASRGAPIRRIERYALGINRVDRLEGNLGVELFAAQERIRPFVEYGIAAPMNRQGYHCRPNNPSGDKCLANTKVAPSSLTIGARVLPWKSGFHLTAALDVGITGVGTFIEEVRPTPPWTFYFGAGWAFDTVDRPERVRVVETRVPVAGGREIHGFVHEAGKAEGIPNVVVAWANRPELTSLVTGVDGRFVTRKVEDGTYVFSLGAEGYEAGQCTAMVAGPPTSTLGSAPPPLGADDTNAPVVVDCILQALPREGSLDGRVKDGETQAPVAATVKIVGADKKESAVTADASGAFHAEHLAAGSATATIEANGYLAVTENVAIEPRKRASLDVALKPRPKKSSVAIAESEIVIKQQILFAVDSATILPESNGLLGEIADALIAHPRIRHVEVQGHTDDTGTPEHNLQLSTDRAKSVVSWLTAHGVAADRLVAKGYGSTKPILPNVTTANRAKNRRVQFIILEQDAEAKEPASTSIQR